MKKILITLLLTLLSTCCYAEKEFVNLTPRPKSATSFDGRVEFPATFSVAVSTALGDTVVSEAQRFVDLLNKTMGNRKATLTRDTETAFIRIHPHTGLFTTIGSEGYRLVARGDTIGIFAATQVGFFNAFQSIKKMLPSWVALGLPESEDLAGTSENPYWLPCVSITDKPRFSYRSFMLDCSRHFFSVDELKRMLDIMAVYKMNTFHWHLTDDQGWRAEIKKYPRLTNEGAKRSKNWSTPIHLVDDYWWTGEGIWDEKTYGPYYYSQDDMREIVAYAAERHIEIIPEIEMPGHAVAAMVAYPELSCTPNAKRSVWTNGGISEDVMNIANPATIQFCKDVIDELCEIFPGRYFHIGGDECPTSAWNTNADCKALMESLNLKNIRELQSHFTNLITGYLAEKGKRTIVWNESITAEHANIELVKEHNPIIMCWNPCQNAAAKAVSIGLDAIITEYHGSAAGASGAGGYYINRRQSADYGEPTGAGSGDDTVEGCYNYVSVNANDDTHYLGVQGTFWTEHVDSDEYLEYLALPRLVCIAEAGWTQQSRKKWDGFVERLVRDTEIFDKGGYVYARHWMPDYQHRTYTNPLTDGAIVQFTNQSADRGRCLRDNNGQLYAQGDACTNFILEQAGGEGQYYIRSEESGKYLYAEGLTSEAQVLLSTAKTKWQFDETTMPGYVAICPCDAPNLAVNNKCSTTSRARLFAHASSNGASFWKVQLMGETSILPPTTNNELNAASAIYDLQGRRVIAPSKGIYFQNGKKQISVR